MQTTILLIRKNYDPLNWKYGLGGEISIWIMKKGYKSLGPFDYAQRHESQTFPAEEIEICENKKIYLFGSPGKEWLTWKEDIINVFRENYITRSTKIEMIKPPPKKGEISEKESIHSMKQKLKSGTPEEK